MIPAIGSARFKIALNIYGSEVAGFYKERRSGVFQSKVMRRASNRAQICRIPTRLRKPKVQIISGIQRTLPMLCVELLIVVSY